MKQSLAHKLSEALSFYSKTQEQFARDVGVSVTTVSRWINGRKIPRSHAIILKIEEVLRDYETEKYQELSAASEPNKPAA